MWIKDNKKKKKTKKDDSDGGEKKSGIFGFGRKGEDKKKKKKRWTFLHRFGPDYLNCPAGMVVSPEHGSLIVCDKGANQVRLVSLEGKLVGQFGGKGDSIGHLNGPVGVCVGAEGKMMITEYWNNRVQMFSAEGRPLRTFSVTARNGESQSGGGGIVSEFTSGGLSPGAGSGINRVGSGVGGSSIGATGENQALRCPWGICVGPGEKIYVADGPNHVVRVFTADGEYLRAFGSEGSGKGQLFFPRDLMMDVDNNVLVVADNGNHRLQMLDPETGEHLGSCGVRRGDGPGELNYPSSVCLGPDGNYIIADQDNHRLDVYTPEGEFIEMFGSWGTKNTQFEKPIHISCDRESGLLYVVEEGKPHVKVFQY